MFGMQKLKSDFSIAKMPGWAKIPSQAYKYNFLQTSLFALTLIFFSLFFALKVKDFF